MRRVLLRIGMDASVIRVCCTYKFPGHNYLHGSCLLTWIILLHCNHQLTKSFGPIASRYSFLCTSANSLPVIISALARQHQRGYENSTCKHRKIGRETTVY